MEMAPPYELKQVTAAVIGSEQPLYAVESGVYTVDTISWLGQQPYHSWVVFPPQANGRARLAVRVDQTATAAQLISSFAREVLFSGGVAVITFISFMAGFSYRQRQLSAENAAIRFLALHDELTGLPNRKQFEEFMAETLAGVEQDGTQGGAFRARPRRLQIGQRHARPSGRRRSAQGLRQAAEGVAQRRRPPGAAFRRRVRDRRAARRRSRDARAARRARAEPRCRARSGSTATKSRSAARSGLRSRPTTAPTSPR